MSSLNHIFKFGTTVLAALVLSACGSSGGGSDTPDGSQVDNQTNLNQSNSFANNNVVQPQTNNETGAAIVISGEDRDIFVSRAAINGYNTTSINVDGTNVAIGYPGISAGNWTNISANGRLLEVCCGRYSDTRFGVSDSLDDNGKAYLFYNGNPTLNMPTSGSASYYGQSIISADIPALDDEDFYTGSSQFNVDFGNKSLSGSLDIRNIQPVNINGSISGNTFSGYASSASLSTAPVEGRFYGEQAKELSGLAKAKDNSWGAAFGAQKQ